MESIQWKAVYKDGELKQEGHKYTDIDRSRLEFFELWDKEKLIFRLHLGEGKKLIFRKRVALDMSSKITKIVYLVGWQKNIQGENIQSIAAIFDDHVEMINRFQEKTEWFYPINFLPEEK